MPFDPVEQSHVRTHFPKIKQSLSTKIRQFNKYSLARKLSDDNIKIRKNLNKTLTKPEKT